MHENGPGMLRFGDYLIDTARGCLRTADDREIGLRPKSFEVLRYLAESGGRLVSKEEMLKAVWRDVVVGDESLAQCVSEVRRAIGDHGQAVIKTVPRRGYRFVALVSQKPAAAPTDGQGQSRPRVAVLRFANMNGDPAHDYLSDGISEDVITELSRFSELVVIARNSSFQFRGKAVDARDVGARLGARYLLEGSVRRQADRVRVTAQLVDAATGGHLWAEHYDRRIADVFAVQDELARTLAAILAVRVTKAEAERVLLRAPSSWQAHEYYLRAAEAFRLRGRSREAVDDARRLATQALALDPEYARSHALLSKIEWWNYVEPVNDDYLRPATLGRAHQLAQRAVQLAPDLPEAHAQLGWTLIFQRAHRSGIEEFQRAFALNRNFVDNRFALALTYAGTPREAVAFLDTNIHLDPFQPFDSFGFRGHAQYMLGEYAAAAGTLSVYPSRAPIVRVLPLWLAAAQARSGSEGEARAQARAVLQLEPHFRIARWSPTAVYHNPGDAERLFDGLRKAGLPA
jgi:adenylate cyclase